MINRSALTQFRCFTENEGVSPELAHWPVVEALVTDRLFQPFGHQDECHVAPGPDGTKDTGRGGMDEQGEDEIIVENQTLQVS